MKHLDLFSGIGGFSLAASRVWPNHKPTFCEIDPYCQAVLRKHWPHATIYSDIKGLAPYAGYDLLTGGFPCQPFSAAGQRRGTADDRYLWPEMLRVIRLAQPTWIVGENVGGFVTWNDGMVLEQVYTDLEGEGYEVQAFIIPACAVSAPHRRDRVWIIAYHADTGPKGLQEGKDGVPETRRTTADTKCERERRCGQFETKGQRGERGGVRCNKGANWKEDWPSVAARLCRVDDGVPRRMDRNPRLKALGNAIVPQVAEMIFRSIAQIP